MFDGTLGNYTGTEYKIELLEELNCTMLDHYLFQKCMKK